MLLSLAEEFLKEGYRSLFFFFSDSLEISITTTSQVLKKLEELLS